MVAYLTTPVRALLLAAALAFTGQAFAANEPSAAARPTARTQTDAPQPDETPLGGVLLIVGLVGVVILLAWVCSRIGDSRSHVTN